MNIEERLEQIWNKYKDVDNELYERGFAFCIDPINDNSVLFIGLNPSFNNGAENGNLKYSNNNASNLHPYFKKIKSIGIENISHHDLLYLRETNAKKIDELLKNETGVGFIWEQLMLSKEIIEEAKPKIIIAANTTARLFFGKDKNTDKNINVWLDYEFAFDNEIGTHRIKTKGNLFDMPVFFTSMLSGQRAMDNGSFERLQWHINFVLNKL